MYISTRDNYEKVPAARAIKLGMVPAGGLFVPVEVPRLKLEDFQALKGASYQEVAESILALYLDGYTRQEIRNSIALAYNDRRFDSPEIVPLQKINDQTFVMELWHGPTAAFKDMALQVMPHLLSQALEKVGSDREIVILVATSGDTGKAALEGFKNVPGIKIVVFFPHQGVSKVQELQMTTTDGDNTYVVAVRGNFDDCQSAVKEIFGSVEFNRRLEKHGWELSSANSINWGRLLPQIVYYVYAYLNLLERKEIKENEKINFVVPTGNFGNILAGWYAAAMGLPVNKLICASNENRVLTDFFHTGVYNRARHFLQTMSPSMDILVSSNLERFLYEITGHDGERIARWMSELNKTGRFTADRETMEAISNFIAAGFASEEETLDTIRKYFISTGYTLDPHTAVGMKVYEKYVEETGDGSKTVVDATASPFKFNASVLKAIKGSASVEGKDEFAILRELSETTRQSVHPALLDLAQRPVRHERVCDKTALEGEVERILGI
ncbi:MAG: threonine synthase [Peptococcaceae bacterium]|jgi:threonine synthase|nr:threonine synthase [Peptococcaceae bacterium]MDH7524893.1 threonine synthase [Peptococcaceae bacterium]